MHRLDIPEYKIVECGAGWASRTYAMAPIVGVGIGACGVAVPAVFKGGRDWIFGGGSWWGGVGGGGVGEEMSVVDGYAGFEV